MTFKPTKKYKKLKKAFKQLEKTSGMKEMFNYKCCGTCAGFGIWEEEDMSEFKAVATFHEQALQRSESFWAGLYVSIYSLDRDDELQAKNTPQFIKLAETLAQELGYKNGGNFDRTMGPDNPELHPGLGAYQIDDYGIVFFEDFGEFEDDYDEDEYEDSQAHGYVVEFPFDRTANELVGEDGYTDRERGYLERTAPRQR